MEYDESRVYTSLNADKLKIGDKVYIADNLYDLKYNVENDCNFAVIREIYNYESEKRFAVMFINNGLYDAFNLAYLVDRAKEEKCRPFKDIDELINAWKEKTGITARANTMPLIWLRNKESKCIGSISSFDAIDVFIFGCWKHIDDLFDEYEFLDGTPCGVKE